MFTLQRVYAFAVTPQRRVDEGARKDPAGGAVKLTPQLREVITNAFEKVARGALATVDFDADDDRSHPVRDDLLGVAFGATKTPGAASARLAHRLAETMDNRSRSALLLLAVEANDPKRRVSLLLFPREDVVQLGGLSRDEYLLKILRDAFSTGSGLRKLARSEGHDSRTQFLSAEVLDFQLGSTKKTTADFWIESFLKAKPRIDSRNGTRQLSHALQRAFDASGEAERDAVFAAMFKASSSRVTRTSLDGYAEAEIPESLHDVFLRGLPAEVARAVFTVDHALVKENLSRRVITAEDGVVISAPAETIGRSVEITQRADVRTVTYSGSVETERVVRDSRAAESGNAKRTGKKRR